MEEKCKYCNGSGVVFLENPFGQIVVDCDTCKVTEKSSIKPCPFCSVDDGKVIKEELTNDTKLGFNITRKYIEYYVECQCCESRGPRSSSEIYAIEEWNAASKEKGSAFS